jgi:hypothetical protein
MDEADAEVDRFRGMRAEKCKAAEATAVRLLSSENW